MADSQQLTRILDQVNRGDEVADLSLFALVYEELHELASGQMRGERAGHTLQPTALVHEAYLRLFGSNEVEWQNRAHFFSAAAQVMRRILVDHARRHLAQKRGGDAKRVDLDEIGERRWESGVPPEELVAIDEALMNLEEQDPENARIVRLHFFAGLSFEQIANVLGVSTRTVRRKWRLARAILYRQIEGP